MNIPQAFGDQQLTLADTGASDYRVEGPPAAEHDLPSVVVGGLRWSLVESRVTPKESLLDRATVEADVLVENTLATTDVRVSERLVRLATRNGTDLGKGRFVDETNRISVPPGESRRFTIQFYTGHDQDPAPGSLQLVIGESGRIPAMLPLAGAVRADDEPVFVAVEEVPALLEDPDDPQRQILVTPDAAAFSINAGPYRAAEGERLALVDVIVERTASSETSGFLETSYWALETDQGIVPAILVARTSQPTSNSDQVTLLFAFDDTATDFAIVAAADTSESASFSVVVPGG